MNLNKIAPQEMIEALSKDMATNFLEIANLQVYLNDPKRAETVNCYRADDFLIITYGNGEGAYHSIIPTSPQFDLGNLSFYVEKVEKGVSLSFELPAAYGGNASAAYFDNNLSLSKTGGMASYIKDKSTNKDILNSSEIRFLTKACDDAELVNSFENEQLPGRPPLSVLFNIFVEEEEGYVLAVIENNEIIAYLTYDNTNQNYYDIDYVYVKPQHRGRGLGVKLAEYYSEKAVSQGGIAYWSSAINKYSDDVAVSAGFIQLKQSYSYIKK